MTEPLRTIVFDPYDEQISVSGLYLPSESKAVSCMQMTSAEIFEQFFYRFGNSCRAGVDERKGRGCSGVETTRSESRRKASVLVKTAGKKQKEMAPTVILGVERMVDTMPHGSLYMHCIL